MAATEGAQRTDDEAILHRLGYAQVLYREMGGFSNFAISFTIISILAGCLTSYYLAFNNGGPVAITWGWLLVGAFCILVAMAMGEIASAMPTAGALYFWASKLGGPAWGWFTGWFNLVGEIAVTASIQYGSAIFTTALLNLWFPDMGNETGTIFIVLTVIVALQLALNLLNINVLALLNTVSAWWHMVGVAVVVAVLAFVPENHQSAAFVFGETINNSGFSDTAFWFVFGIGLLMSQYTITGFDASAHMSEETRGASRTAALGMIMAVVASVVFGFILLVAVTFAVPDVQGVLDAGGDAVIYIWTVALGDTWTQFLLIIAVLAQLFCGTASVTASSRMLFAFSRDRAVPFHNVWRKVASNRVPVNAVTAISVLAWALMLPTLVNGVLGYAVGTSIAVIGLYIAFGLPIVLRIKAGDRFEPGAWSLGNHYKWVSTISVVWIGLVCILFLMPLSPAGVPFSAEFDWEAVNYAPLTVGGALILFGGWYLLSARNWFTGPVPEGGSLAELQSIEQQLDAEAHGAATTTTAAAAAGAAATTAAVAVAEKTDDTEKADDAETTAETTDDASPSTEDGEKSEENAAEKSEETAESDSDGATDGDADDASDKATDDVDTKADDTQADVKADEVSAEDATTQEATTQDTDGAETDGADEPAVADATDEPAEEDQPKSEESADAADAGEDSESAGSDNAESGKADSDEADSGEANSDETDSDEADSESTGTETAEDAPATDEAATDEAATDEAATDEAATDEAATDEAATDEAATDEAAAPETSTEATPDTPATATPAAGTEVDPSTNGKADTEAELK